jgi:hypothetical protein
MTRLERLIDEQIARTVPGTISVGVEKMAEELAKEFIADPAVRQLIHETVSRRAQELLRRLLAEEAPAKETKRRKK